MRIALCDDDETSLNTLETLVDAFCREQMLAAEIDRFGSGEEFLRAGKTGDPFDIIFMDIYLNPGEPTGMSVIRSLGISRGTQVVFVTTSRDHALEAYGLNAVHYLTKPATREAVAEAMRRCLDRFQSRTFRTLNVKTRLGNIAIPMETIAYIEVFDKLAVIHTSRENFETRASLNSLAEQLDERLFMRVQRSFLVNMASIDSINFDRLLMKDGTLITLSRNNRSDLKNQYQQFLFRFARED